MWRMPAACQYSNLTIYCHHPRSVLMNVPLELVHLIVEHLIEIPEPKPHWQVADSFSCASKAYREILLEHWFSTLFVESSETIRSIAGIFPSIFTKWTRELCIRESLPSCMDSWNIDSFVKLRKIRLDWRRPSFTTPQMINIRGETVLPFSHLGSARITEFECRDVDWPSPYILESIANTFPGLRKLILRQRRIWCGLCNTCVTPKFAPPGPTTITYNGGFGIPLHYATVLSKLEHLESIHISPSAYPSGRTHLNAEKGGNDLLWIGECDQCMTQNYSDEVFRDAWVKQKVAHKERPPSLRKVVWAFGDMSESDEGSEASGSDHDEGDDDS